MKHIIAVSLILGSVIAFQNPVIDNQNVPDPGAIYFNGAYYVVTTGGDNTGKFPIHRSSDLQSWDYIGMALN